MLRDGDAVDSRLARPGAVTDAAPIRSGRTLFLRILAPFVIAMVALTLSTIAGFEVLSAVRAFVGGESLWSKGRAEAVQALKAYAVSGRPEDRHELSRMDHQRGRAGQPRGAGHLVEAAGDD